MVHQCAACDRSFTHAETLSRHLQESSAHQCSVATSAHDAKQLSGNGNRTTKSQHAGSLSSGLKNTASPTTSNQWSAYPLDQHGPILDVLATQCHGSEELLNRRFALQPYTAKDVDCFSKCKNCGGVRKDITRRNSVDCTFHPERKGIAHLKGKKPKKFSCCETSHGCVSLPSHKYANPSPETIEKYSGFAASPPPSSQHPKFRAVVLDCEMAGAVGGMDELVAVSAVEYLTGSIILNVLVAPVKKIRDWRSRYHGVTKGLMSAAIARGEALEGWQKARDALWEYIDADTIVIGHALQNDLRVLRMIHPRVVDSEILSTQAVGSNRQRGLQTLCREFLNINIRANERGTHDCLEDVLATREVVLWCTLYPEELKRWATIKRVEEARLIEERDIQREEMRQEKLLEEEERYLKEDIYLEEEGYLDGGVRLNFEHDYASES